MSTSWRIERLEFHGPRERTTALTFPRPFTFVYGASNTGKSFAVKALDFMFGGNRELPQIDERRPYSAISLQLRLPKSEHIRLERAIAGGDFSLTAGDGTIRTLASRHSRENTDNLSNFLLGHLDSQEKEIAKDKSGTKRPLSFRDIVRLCIVDETSIQSELSPIESGNISLAPSERNIFKYMLTGDDDAAMVTHQKPKDFRTGRAAQLRFIEELIADIDAEVSREFPDKDDLRAQAERIEVSLKNIEADIVATRASARAALDERSRLIAAISLDQRRINDIAIGLENFRQLQTVYSSDISRLEAIEEAGFLLGVDANRACPVCGAPPEAQAHDHSLIEIEKTRIAAEVEIAKIEAHQTELSATIAAADAELQDSGARLLSNREALQRLEEQLRSSSPDAEEQQRKFAEIIPKRDHINYGLELINRRETLEKQRIRIEKAKQTRQPSNFQGGLSTQVAQEFADEVTSTLEAWDFPGDKRAVFDIESHDLIIGGKHRRFNGKGVRAITHAAFKVALLTYCRARNRPHPGFLVLDTPLITYRDPIQSRGGALTLDEAEIVKTNLKERFFQHLGSLADQQIIVFDNTDPPATASAIASVQPFTNNRTEGRQGLL